MYAVIKTGGKQYSVKVGDVVYVEKLNAEDNSEVTFDQVLAVGEEGSVKVGAPVVEGATVTAKVIKNGKGKKLNNPDLSSKKAAWSARVIVSLTPRWKSPRSTAKEVNHNGTIKKA